MGEDLSTGAKIGIVLIILCFLIGIVLALLMVVKNITNSGASSMEAGLDQMSKSTYDDYDQKIVTGTKVPSAIKLFEGQPIGIVVISKQAAANSVNGGYCYGQVLSGYSKTTEDGEDVYKNSTALTMNTGDSFFTTSPQSGVWNLNTKPLTISGSNMFVRTNAKFMAELIKDSSGTNIGICFTQQT